MSIEQVQKIADAVMFEGYMLYPYRPSSVKNRQRWTFGGLYPKRYADRNGDASGFHSEVLLKASNRPLIEVRVRFLHLMSEEKDGRTWQLGVEHEVILPDLDLGVVYCRQSRFPASCTKDHGLLGRQEQISALVEVGSERLEANLYKLSVRVSNMSEFPESLDVSREEASMHALNAAHAILHVDGGEFISSTDPPALLRQAASRCSNRGVWPVLAGEEPSGEWMLLSPIILSDYPQIAPESPGDLFDGTEIDEILTLRVLTMTDQEKQEMRNADPRARDLLARTESLSPQQMMRLHGALRNPHMPIGRTEE
jgi:hypothetical protein